MQKMKSGYGVNMANIQLVDENDTPIGGGTKQQAWEQGLFHRVVRLIIVDENGRMYMQHRAATKYPFPSHWDNSVAGHVDEDETYEVAALRELVEETGINDALPLEEVDYYQSKENNDGRKLNRFTKLFRVKINSSRVITLDPEEADEGRWFTREEAQSLLDDPEAQLTAGGRIAINKQFPR